MRLCKTCIGFDVQVGMVTGKVTVVCAECCPVCADGEWTALLWLKVF